MEGFYIFVLIALLLIIITTISASFAYRSEKRVWNNGVCKKSGKVWVQFDTDSNGSRGYRDGENNFCWISWPLDRVYLSKSKEEK